MAEKLPLVEEEFVAYQLTCPCGEIIVALEAEFLDLVNKHLSAAHPGRIYSEDAIMMMSLPIPDRVARQSRA